MRCVLGLTDGSANLYGVKERLEERPEDELERILQGIVNQRFPGAALDQGEFTDLSHLGKPFGYRVEARAPHFVEERGDRWVIATGLEALSLCRVFLGRVERLHPIVFRQIREQREEVTVHLGPYDLVSLPPNRLFKGRFGAYAITYDQPDEKTLRITRRFHLLPFEVPPEGYPSLIEYCQKVDEADRRPIGVRPHSP